MTGVGVPHPPCNIPPMRLHGISRFYGPLFAIAYAVVWVMLWPTEQPYWVLPFGLRFGALLLTRIQYWPWILGAEIAGSAFCEWRSGLPIGGAGFVLGDAPEP